MRRTASEIIRNLENRIARLEKKAMPMGRVPGDRNRGHQLMPKGVGRKIPALYSQDGNEDPIVHARFFSPYNGWTWLVTEYDGKDTMFGAVKGQYDWEIGYIDLNELQSTNRNGLPMVERDMYFKPMPLSRAKNQ